MRLATDFGSFEVPLLAVLDPLVGGTGESLKNIREPYLRDRLVLSLPGGSERELRRFVVFRAPLSGCVLQFWSKRPCTDRFQIRVPFARRYAPGHQASRVPLKHIMARLRFAVDL